MCFVKTVEHSHRIFAESPEPGQFGVNATSKSGISRNLRPNAGHLFNIYRSESRHLSPLNLPRLSINVPGLIYMQGVNTSNSFFDVILCRNFL